MRVSGESQPSLARPQVTFQAPFHLGKLRQLSIDRGDFGTQQVTHMGARVTFAAPQNQKLANLGQGKTQRLGLRYELEVAHGAFVKQAESALASSWLSQQPQPLVKPDGMNAEVCLPRHFANLQRMRHPRLPPLSSFMMHPRHDSRVKNFLCVQVAPHETRRQLALGEQVGLVLPNILPPQAIGRALEMMCRLWAPGVSSANRKLHRRFEEPLSGFRVIQPRSQEVAGTRGQFADQGSS